MRINLRYVGYAVLALVAFFIVMWVFSTIKGCASAIVPTGSTSGGTSSITVSPILWKLLFVGLIAAVLYALFRGVAGNFLWVGLVIAGLIWLFQMGGIASIKSAVTGLIPTGIPPMGAPSPSATPTPGTSAIPSIPRLGTSPFFGLDWADILVSLFAIYLAIRIIRALFGGTVAAPKAMSSGWKIFWIVAIIVGLWYAYAATPGFRRWVNNLSATGKHTAGAVLAPALTDKFQASSLTYQRQGKENWVVYNLDLDESPPAFGDLWLKFILPETSVKRKFEVKVNGRIYSAVQMPFPGACQISLINGSLKGATAVKVAIRGLEGWRIPAPLGPMTLYQR